MTLATAAALLQSALMLMSVLQANPQLAPEAQQAIVQAVEQSVQKATDAVASYLSAQVGSAAATSTTSSVGLPLEPGLLVATPTVGTAPLSVAFTGPQNLSGISYGDGAYCGDYPRQDGLPTSWSVPCRGTDGALKPHVYKKSGSYIVRATHSTPGGSVGEMAITVLDVTADMCPVLLHDFGPGESDDSTGGEVTKLQHFLVLHGYADEMLISGYFDEYGTLQNLIRFQEKHGVEAAGVVGPRTRAAIRETCAE